MIDGGVLQINIQKIKGNVVVKGWDVVSNNLKQYHHFYIQQLKKPPELGT